jgi:nitrogen fixation protein NifU and related proteins
VVANLACIQLRLVSNMEKYLGTSKISRVIWPDRSVKYLADRRNALAHPRRRVACCSTMSRYSETLMEHFSSPRNSGHLDCPDLIGHVGMPGQGPFFILYLRVRAGRIEAAKFQTYGCGSTIASGSMLTEMIAGRTVEDCRAITTERLVEALDGVPPDKLHSPTMAVAALHDALRCCDRVG